MKTIFGLLLILMTVHSAAQEIAGTVLDEKKQPMISASVHVFQGGVQKGEAVTDYDGIYVIKPLDPGYYDMAILYAGFDSFVVKGVVVTPGNRTTINANMRVAGKELKEVTIKWTKPLVDKDKPGATILTRKEINSIPTMETRDLIGLTPGTYQNQRGKDVNIGGARHQGTLYIIDGVQVHGSQGLNMSQNSVDATAVAPRFSEPSLPSYKKYTENDFMNVAVNPLSTMSVDVDRASYSNVRRIINEGQKPPVDAVRIEEMINYFDYTYPQPVDDNPVAIATELTDCPWQKENKLLHVGIQALKVETENLPPSNLVFLIDVSGSMGSAERLPLLVAGLKLLVNNLREQDKVAIVVYAGSAGLVLPPTPGNHKETIIAALDRLEAGGSTAGGAGIELAYKVASERFIKGGNNRVLLATDGDFNVGISRENDLEDLIVKKRETGIFLTCLGFGTDNYKDSRMELLADKGNGNYDYIDNIQEAQKALVSEFGGTLFTVAKDVKAQIEFNPAKVQGYRLIGYENRLLNEEDFKDDKKDAGDMGSGHTVTILYEIIPAGVKSKLMRDANELKYQRPSATNATGADELATIKFRYKKPDGNKSREMTHVIADNAHEWTNASDNMRFASSVAMFGMLLKGSKYKGTCSYEEVMKEASNSRGADKDGYKAEFVRLVKAAEAYDAKTSAR